MGQDLIIRGLPGSLAKDAWWMESGAGAIGGSGQTAPPGPLDRTGWQGRRGPVLIALIALGDFLFFDQAPGLSLALFAFAVFAAASLGQGGRHAVRPAVLLAVAALPVVDYVQALSVGFLLGGLVTAVAWVRIGPSAGGRVLVAAGQLLRSIPVAGPRWLATLMVRAPQALRMRISPRQGLRDWAFAVGGALVLAALLTDANPIFSGWLAGLLQVNLDLAALLRRAAFWTGLALAVWPFLARPALDRAKPFAGLQVKGQWLGLNPASATNALMLFNLMLGLQTLMDARCLWTGAGLPDGLSFGAYAQRGAYPLLITALLAGAFALATRPFVAESLRLRRLVLLWLGQNVALTLSAVLRLKLYVAAYGLTYLRLHAGIWMALVAAGLALTGWQILRGLPNRWLLIRTTTLGLGVLYLSAFIKFASLIAAYDLARPEGADLHYVCALGSTAAVTLHQMRPGERACGILAPQIEGWRDWGFRNWQVRRYLDASPGGAVE